MALLPLADYLHRIDAFTIITPWYWILVYDDESNTLFGY